MQRRRMPMPHLGHAGALDFISLSDLFAYIYFLSEIKAFADEFKVEQGMIKKAL